MGRLHFFSLIALAPNDQNWKLMRKQIPRVFLKQGNNYQCSLCARSLSRRFRSTSRSSSSARRAAARPRRSRSSSTRSAWTGTAWWGSPRCVRGPGTARRLLRVGPRRVAAMTVAKRVAQEMDTALGQLVGYTVRFEDVTSRCTKVKFLTDGMLLREAIADSRLMAYSVVVLDEAHERTVHTDVLFGIVKQAQRFRADNGLKPLKVVVMSATMDVDHFSRYFGGIPAVYVEGRQFPVQVFHSVRPQEDHAFSSLVSLFQIHREAPPNADILVFLTGQEEIEAMAYNARLIAKDLEGQCVPLKVYPLYASLPSQMQLDVFRPTPQGARKVVLSTNIAETSVTISGIKYVIDCGKVKNRTHHPGTGLDVLKVESISQEQAWQRTGRAGRESEGFCYRNYTRQEFERFSKNTVPEIQRCNVASVVLQLLALGVDAATFDFMDKPPPEAVQGAVKLLRLLGAVEGTDAPRLTEVGRTMAQFPLDPRFSKAIIAARDLNCVEEVLSIVAVLSGESIFVTPPSKRERAAAAHHKFLSAAGDHITMLNVFRNYASVPQKKLWCQENLLHTRNLHYASKVREQLADLCARCGVALTSCGQDTEAVRRCLLAGLFTSVAELHRDRHYITVDSRQVVAVHPASALALARPPCVLFTELVQTGRCYMRHLSEVEPAWLEDVAPEYARLHRLAR
ncbi:ATP-dependent RNA helicase DHX33 isoform X2 [Bacillus rossius redtenbacheri]|uniref:ATP-dependent RNA helicase DHX33 isoform X2 n=1 Tax=Bacillus rossius redtenbacheri TaxID=93214 RepID=UPI002FDE2034